VNARESAVVVTPFIDSGGIELLEESWDTRTNDARWQIFVRKTSGRLIESARRRGWGLFEYDTQGQSGMHAKIVSIDNERLILGSMNLLKRNMYSNLEIGVEIRDDPIIRKMRRLESWLEEACDRRLVR
jgi:phosphatidylserine/phosphatidylglycerophosphate/cardiolipin synthase-like enzyme